MKRKFLILVSVLLVTGLLAACSSTPAQVSVTNPTPRTITAAGTGEVYIVPDIAYINVGVHTEADDVSTALSNNNTQAANIASTLENLGVDKKDIQTSNFNVYPMKNYAPDGTVTRTYYAVDNTIYITVRNLSSMGKLLDAVVKNGANSINGITFDVKDKDAVTAQARDMAISNAKAEAEGIAKAAGVTLDQIQTVNISSGSTPAPVYNAARMGQGGGGSAEVPISAGQMMISVDASITYTLK